MMQPAFAARDDWLPPRQANLHRANGRVPGAAIAHTFAPDSQDPPRSEEARFDREPAPLAGAAQFRLLVVEDDEILASALAAKLERNSIFVEAVASARAALRALEEARFDLAIIDIGLPDGSGLDVCREIRLQSDLPVMFLTGLDSVPERLTGFDVGADDYMVKPVSLHEVIRRVRALLRRRPARSLAPLLEGPEGLLLDRIAHRASANGRSLHLTLTEFSILSFLLERRHQAASADEISRAVWGHETFGHDNYVQQHISRLRSKLRAAGVDGVIHTLHGRGYTIS